MTNQLYKNKEWLIEQYKTKSTIEIAKEVGITKQSLLKWFNKFNIERRQGSEAKRKGVPSYNIKYFKNINTRSKAYWLGFIMADGCVTKTKYGYAFQMGLSIKDSSHIDKLANAINFSNKLLEVFINDSFGYKKSATYKRKFIKLENVDFCENLINHNVIPNKTGNEKVPCLENRLYRDFIRGVFDGDGCITWHYRKDKPNTLCAKVNIVCKNKEFLNEIKTILNHNANIDIEKISIYKSRNIWSLEICSLKNIKLFSDYIYTEKTPNLKRKKDKFKEPLKYYNNKQKI